MAGHDVFVCLSASAAKKRLTAHKTDLCVLDVQLDRTDGYNLAADILKHDPHPVVAFLSAQESREDIMQGLRMGATDYIKGSLDTQEITARLTRLMTYTKICEQEKNNVFEIGSFVLDTIQQTLLNVSTGVKTPLTYKESELLRILIINKGKIVERNWALKTLWTYDTYSSTYKARSMDVYISKLRRLLADDRSISIVNKRGVGYMLLPID